LLDKRFPHMNRDFSWDMPYKPMACGPRIRARPVMHIYQENRVMEIRRLQPGKRMSQAVVHNGTVYLAGQVAEDTGQDVVGQTRQVLASIDALLKEAGTDKTRLLTTTIVLADMATFADMNSVWDGWVAAGNTPARATIEARLAAPQYRVEIIVTAAL
jgi:enamine deaminase RidA (YjgF/YER057c/UK114 family)